MTTVSDFKMTMNQEKIDKGTGWPWSSDESSNNKIDPRKRINTRSPTRRLMDLPLPSFTHDVSVLSMETLRLEFQRRAYQIPYETKYDPEIRYVNTKHRTPPIQESTVLTPNGCSFKQAFVLRALQIPIDIPYDPLMPGYLEGNALTATAQLPTPSLQAPYLQTLPTPPLTPLSPSYIVGPSSTLSPPPLRRPSISLSPSSLPKRSTPVSPPYLSEPSIPLSSPSLPGTSPPLSLPTPVAPILSATTQKTFL